MQMSVAATWALQTEYPTPFGGLIALLSSLTEMALPRLIPLSCIMAYDHHSHVVLATLVPLILMGASAAFAVALAQQGRERLSDRCCAAALLICFIFLPTTSTTLFRTLDCERLDNGDRFLLAVRRARALARAAIGNFE